MKKSIQTASRLLAVSLACLAVLMAQAREPTSFPNRRVDDSTGIVWQRSPEAQKTVAPATGATLLPGTMPAGNYTNHAPFSLFLAVTPPEHCYNFGIYVSGELAAWVNDACESSKTSVSVVVPPYSSFSFGAGDARVTALANGVSWAPTQINFDYLIGQYFVKNEAVLFSKNQYDEQEPCAWNGDYFLTYKNNQTGKENIVKRSGTFGTCSF